MDTQELLTFCLQKGLLLDKDVLKVFAETSDAQTAKFIISKVSEISRKKIITRDVIDEYKDRLHVVAGALPQPHQKEVENIKIKLGLQIEISKEIRKPLIQETKEFDPGTYDEALERRVKIMSLPPTQGKKLEVKDFVRHLRGRYQEMSAALRERGELKNVISINKIASTQQQFSLIGLVSHKRITKSKNMILEIEDLTGKVLALVNANKPELFEKAEEITLDSVIGFRCSGSREMVFVNDIFFPDTMLFERKKSPVEEYALFTGDLHVGVDKFLEKNFLKFIDYLNGKVPNTPEVEKIKYLFIVGDVVAGVGIYPGQEHELVIPDVEEQYMHAARLLKKIRKDITIIISPGNHDALRIMEPQPLLDEKYAWPLYEMSNVILTGNPALVNIGADQGSGDREAFDGFNVLTYHGYSFHYYANTIPRLMKEKATHAPEKIMKYLLQNRHLAPTHASTLFFPGEDDHSYIREAPDIFLSGHTHKSGLTYHNNILVISSSCWESKTAFQEKMGNEPDFCKVPMLNLKTRAMKMLDFE